MFVFRPENEKPENEKLNSRFTLIGPILTSLQGRNAKIFLFVFGANEDFP